MQLDVGLYLVINTQIQSQIKTIWWNKDSMAFGEDCITDDFELVKNKFKNYKKKKKEDYGKPLTIEEQVIKTL